MVMVASIVKTASVTFGRERSVVLVSVRAVIASSNGVIGIFICMKEILATRGREIKSGVATTLDR